MAHMVKIRTRHPSFQEDCGLDTTEGSKPLRLFLCATGRTTVSALVSLGANGRSAVLAWWRFDTEGHPVCVHEADALRAISPASFSAYARCKGWEKAERYGDYSDVYAAAGLPEIVLPRTRRLTDYADVASRLVRIFAQEAGADELELLRELTTADRDAIRVRASSDHTVVVDDGLALIDGAKGMISAAARSLFKPAATYRGRPPRDVLDYLKRVQLAGMEQGSFVVTLLPPAVPPAVEGVAEQPRREYIPHIAPLNDESDSALEDEPIERQTTRRLADALGATRQAMMDAIGGDGDGFGNAISSGASANLCDALADMTAPFDALDVSLTWALTRPPRNTNAVSRFEFTKDDSGILREAARVLRERRVQTGVRLTATIDGLKRQGSELTLKTQMDGGARSVVARVTKVDYERAIDFHKDNAKVELTGDLERLGGRCRLLKPRIVT